jgi:hypothetical protein
MKYNTPDKVNENTSHLSLRFSMEQERRRALEYFRNGQTLPPPSQQPVDDEVYREECSVLPENFLDDINLASYLPDDFQDLYPHGTKCCIALLPFNDGFFSKKHLSPEKWAILVRTKPTPILRALLVHGNGFTQGFGDVTARYYNLFPSILTKDVSEGGTTFKVNYDRHDGRDDRQWFLYMCERALNNLRRFLGQKIKPTSKMTNLKLIK